jgi:hypothetical protein
MTNRGMQAPDSTNYRPAQTIYQGGEPGDIPGTTKRPPAAGAANTPKRASGPLTGQGTSSGSAARTTVSSPVSNPLTRKGGRK